MDFPLWFSLPSAALVGLIIGSFIGMASYRWPREQSWLPASHCPNCQKSLQARWLVPVMSWLALRGRAGCCASPISPRYPLIEASCTLLFLGAAALGLPSGQTALLCLLAATLLFASVIDLETGYIPDGSNLLVALLGGLWLWLRPPESWVDPALSVAQTAGVATLLAGGYSRLRGRDMMGWGDVKLMAASGLWLPAALAPAYLGLGGFLGVAFGLLWQKRGGSAEFPFGPALAVALAGLLVFQLVFH
jgi:prepilin signal peptidase PulO-like enzyme (type II secretory pathway)